MTKKIIMNPRPSKQPDPATADQWVENRAPDVKEPVKRLTLDIPVSLHRTIKAQCAMRDTKMVEEILELLIKKYGNPQ
ncbi:plasmid segregation centromere-binding protein ParG [Nitrosospira sp. Nsp5]|uniref:Plasmid segregation centromere-binding protein ParG n=1 Tax=Nitrosospira multiformis TaxID=1231 RepID=A0ABY0TMW2_9PROT|nr:MULTISPECIES: hypothetical protein [Nitrosospira]PTR05618.1 plasmid segregation centromere-binding protein ParG [Nitrosospira sp. Nsp5]SDR11237.1 plasmid segregation centromere-binding protein ParG [Nitrosospira multiformis]